MLIGGLLKFSMIDYPGKIAAIVFTQGCNLRCKYCHNPELIAPVNNNGTLLKEEDVLNFFEKRKGALEGIVITGGEPTLQTDLAEFAAKLKAMGFLVKLDTNGTNPQAVKDLIDKNLVDFIAMDIKATFDKYEAVCGVPVSSKIILQTMQYIEESGLPYQYRTTYYKAVLNDEDIEKIKHLAPHNFRVQECLPVKQKDILKVDR